MDKNSTFQNEISVYKEEIKYQINILISKGLIDFILLQYNLNESIVYTVISYINFSLLYCLIVIQL